jgi:diguanylate cyclase (GGDEF)-like protein
MTEADLQTEQPEALSLSQQSAARHRVSAVLSVFMETAAASIPVAAVVWTIGLFDKELELNFWICLAITGAAALLATCLGTLTRNRSWSQPARALLSLVQGAGQGEVPIEEFSQIGGRMIPLALAIQEILRVQKLQKAELNEMEREVRGRIANRTDALERKIGSLRHQAMRDALTGLLNRRSMEQEIPRLLTEHLSSARDACLLMIDVDHFKPLNDTLGHVAGDNLLKEIGQIIRSTIREKDMAFRCGGDEFVILLSNTSLNACQRVTKRLVSLVGVLAQPLDLPLPPRLSIGSCALSELETPTARSWLEIADKRLYAIKSSCPNHRGPGDVKPIKKSA